MSFSPKELAAIAKAAHSLKLYRRADLRDDDTDKTLIDQLYVDPLMNEAVLETMLRDSTTFIVGRKGTGKSTIFQRAQHELRKRAGVITAYVDIKTVFEAAEVDPAALASLQKTGLSVDEPALRRLLLYRAFIKAVLNDIREELKRQVTGTGFDNLLARLGLKKSDITSELDELLEGSFELSSTDVTALQQIKRVATISGEVTEKDSSETAAGAEFSPMPKVAGKTSDQSEVVATHSSTSTEEVSTAVLRNINITGVLEKLQRLLGSIDIRKLYIFIDDFSELPEDAMKVFVDAVLAPLNNWSNELIKFKVAGYPNRVYLGKIDPTKIDEIQLDMFRLYGESDVTTMEEKAIDFTRRLVDSRFTYYVGKPFSTYCESDVDAVYRQLFYATMANPRNLGHILANLRDSVLAYGRPIGVRAVQDASTKYYEDKIEPFFGVQKFSHASFSERASTFSLKELLEGIVTKARSLREYKESAVTKEISGRTPSSHFHVAQVLEATLGTLELNFFITLYYEMKDRDGQKVSVYALNHGLCQKFGISFGRPSGHRTHRLYFVERIFDYTNLVRRFLEKNQEIRCTECEQVYGLEVLDSLRMFGMLCPTCKRGTCEVINLSRKYEKVLKDVDPSLLLPATELGILETLYSEDRDMVASEIAGELDCSYQLIGRRGKNLADKGLVNRDRNDDGRRVFNLTDEAETDYFEGNESRELDISESAADN